MTLPQLQRLCKVWQRRLRLQDWKISLQLLPNPVMGNGEAADGLVDWDDEEVTATVTLREGLEETRLESTLVHELLHIRMNDLTPNEGETNDSGLERTINLLADCFLQAYPKRRRPPNGQRSPAPPGFPTQPPA